MTTDQPRATCHGCDQTHLVTTAGIFIRHRRGQTTCPGAGERPQGTTSPATPRRPSGLTSLSPPDEPAAGRSCDAGNCNRPSIGWRLFRGWREWLPVCGLHMEGPAGRIRIYDPEDTP